MKKISVFTDLIKYKLSLAVTFSAVTGYFIYHKSADLSLGLLIVGLFLLASGAAALNQYTERNFDAIMERTKIRPIPQYKIDAQNALFVSLGLLISGSVLLLIIGIVPFFLGIFNVVLYNLIYTRLKRITPLAIIPGALVGAIPPLIGYSSAGGFLPNALIIAFSSFMFLWQIPHFWLIMIKYKEEYLAAGFKTISHYFTEKQAKKLVFVWVLSSSILLFLLSSAGLIFTWPVYCFIVPFNIIFIFCFYTLLFKSSGEKNIRWAFMLINSFSLIIMILFILNSFLT